MKKLLSIILLATILFTSCEKTDNFTVAETEGQATITFDAVFGAQDFALNKNFIAGTKTYNFNKFRYWVNNITLVNAKGEEIKIPNSYYLIQETAALPVQDGAFTYPATKRETVELKGIPSGEYKSIKFNIGVESKYNDNLSLQIGELSQLNGMTNISWMWMTSYIFSSIGGKITEGATTKNMLVETGLNANHKSVSLNLPTSLYVDASRPAAVTLTTDVSKAIDGVDVYATPIVGASQATTMASVATNYATKVFTVKSVN
jgi:hypothetical protein